MKLPSKNYALAIGFSIAACVLEVVFVKIPIEYLVLLSFATLSLPCLLLFFYAEYKVERRQSQIDDMLPAALFQISSFPKSAPFETIFRSISNSGFGALSEEFAKANRQIAAGVPVNATLESMQKRNSSALLRRMCSMLGKFHRSGADASTAFKETAEDVYSLQEIIRETAASLSLQKYTLLLGGSILVPIILALLYSTSSSLEGNFGQNLLDFKPDGGLKEAVLLANQAYLAIFALVSSVFIARSEEKPRKAVLYFGAMAPVSLLLFNVARGAIII